ncbi:unnamed protein product [Protopolystoma xenopodis]|uniref:Uncharacterized protein n=1 Tax=Protopolystoma xenopodis TaxID=117903 RepID=A0A3S5AAD2_9PLAT|nr:unnamed protein product [Protopolystoma xenopodis]
MNFTGNASSAIPQPHLAASLAPTSTGNHSSHVSTSWHATPSLGSISRWAERLSSVARRTTTTVVVTTAAPASSISASIPPSLTTSPSSADNVVHTVESEITRLPATSDSRKALGSVDISLRGCTSPHLGQQRKATKLGPFHQADANQEDSSGEILSSSKITDTANVAQCLDIDGDNF